MKKKIVQKESKSLKTFFLYTGIVLFLIVGSLSIKALFIIQKSKFDGAHEFTIAITKNNRVEELMGFNPSSNSLSVLTFTGSPVTPSLLGQALGIIPSAKINATFDLPLTENMSDTLTSVLLQYGMLHTDVTLYDLARLILLSKNIPDNNRTIQQIKLPLDDGQIDKTIISLFTDDTISSENVSIQIINASDVPGMGKRLERVLTNLGANIVAVSTDQTHSSTSKIQYFGKETYTLGKLKYLLQLPIEKLNKGTIANIVIVIGKDYATTNIF